MLCFLSERLNLKKVYWDFDTNSNTHALLRNVTHLISFKPWSNKYVVLTQQDYYGRWCGTLLHGYCTGTYTEVTMLFLWGNSAVTMEYPHSYSVRVPA